MTKKQKNIYLCFLIFGLAGIYGFSDMKHVFYDILKAALGLSDLQLSQLWGIFGVVAMLSYIGGGFLTDRIAPSKLISAALTLSGLLHLFMSCVQKSSEVTFLILLIISAGMGFCAVFLYFPATSKILTTMSKENTGSIMGKYYGFGGLLTAAIDLIATAVYANIGSELLLFKIIMRFFAVINIAAGVTIGILFWNKNIELLKEERVRIKDIPNVIRQKNIWFLAFIILCNYIVCCMMSYYTPYLTREFGLSEEKALLLGAIRLGVLCLVSGLIWGRWTDRVKSARKVIGLSFGILFMLLVGLIVNDISVHLLSGAIAFTFGIVLISLGIKSVSLVLISEQQISGRIIGTVIGVVSFIGYSPDAFFYPIAGWIVQNFELNCYRILFLIAAASAIAGLKCVVRLKKVKFRS